MILPIEYSDVITLILAIFAFVGIMRGWYKEGITSLFVAALAILVWRPALANEIIGIINGVIKLVLSFFNAKFSLDPSQLSAAAKSVEPDLLLDPNSYRLYIVVMVSLLIVSYFIGEANFKGKVTPLGRLLGGLLGLFNGFVIATLLKQYLLNYLVSQNQYVAWSNQLSIQMTDVPTDNFFAGYGIIFILIVLVGVIALMIAGDRLKLPLK
ncbi:MAG: hypothetical protein JXA89_11675 [Anaerolineae bacterium]|nr:hypothetical protein [Anaerolineae bacterium]